MKKILTASLLLSGLMALGASEITIEKPYFRWLWGGFGFQNSEANLTALMPDDFLNERVLKTFAELSPTFARVYTGFADQNRLAVPGRGCKDVLLRVDRRVDREGLCGAAGTRIDEFHVRFPSTSRSRTRGA